MAQRGRRSSAEGGVGLRGVRGTRCAHGVPHRAPRTWAEAALGWGGDRQEQSTHVVPVFSGHTVAASMALGDGTTSSGCLVPVCGIQPGLRLSSVSPPQSQAHVPELPLCVRAEVPSCILQNWPHAGDIDWCLQPCTNPTLDWSPAPGLPGPWAWPSVTRSGVFQRWKLLWRSPPQSPSLGP